MTPLRPFLPWLVAVVHCAIGLLLIGWVWSPLIGGGLAFLVFGLAAAGLGGWRGLWLLMYHGLTEFLRQGAEKEGEDG